MLIPVTINSVACHSSEHIITTDYFPIFELTFMKPFTKGIKIKSHFVSCNILLYTQWLGLQAFIA